jgi:hypothetical protein
MRTVLLALPLACGIGFIPASAQEQRTSIGVLTCTSAVAPDRQGAADKAQDMTCGFKPTASGAEERYRGTLLVSGTAKAPNEKRVWVWAVIGPARGKIPGGILAQRYVVAAGPSGGPVPALIGESNNSIVLQAETTDDAVSAVTQVELKVLTTQA